MEHELPASDVVRQQVREYLGRTGLAPGDFAHRIDYAPISVACFLQGVYGRIASTDANLKKAALDFMRAHPAAAPDVAAGKLYETENVRALRQYFEEALNGPACMFMAGDPGTQKSFVLQHLVEELNRREISKNGAGRRAYLIYVRERIRPHDLVKRIAKAAGALALGGIDRILDNLRFDFEGRRVLLIFDEAQHLDIACWETVRELYDRPPHCGLLFAGSHRLDSFFTTHALELEQLRSRFQAGHRLPGLTEEEAITIAREELRAGSAEYLRGLVRKCSAPHLHDGGKTSYISARRLFGVLSALRARRQERRQSKGRSPGAAADAQAQEVQLH